MKREVLMNMEQNSEAFTSEDGVEDEIPIEIVDHPIKIEPVDNGDEEDSNSMTTNNAGELFSVFLEKEPTSSNCESLSPESASEIDIITKESTPLPSTSAGPSISAKKKTKKKSLNIPESILTSSRTEYPDPHPEEPIYVSQQLDRMEKDPLEIRTYEKAPGKRKRKHSAEKERARKSKNLAYKEDKEKEVSVLKDNILFLVKHMSQKEKEIEIEKQKRNEAIGYEAVISRLDKIETRLLRIEEILVRQHHLQLPNAFGFPFPSEGSSSSGVSSASIGHEAALQALEHKIHLGEGFMVSRTSWSIMKNAKGRAEWAHGILKGVFGEEAKFYRLLPRKPCNKRFPSAFITVAKTHYREFLLKAGYEEPALAKEIHNLGAFLSDRAMDLIGQRGLAGRNKQKTAS